MELAKDGKINTIYITYKDRLTRFGYNYLYMYFKSHIETVQYAKLR